jgi:osmotically-inducible protein OsmY
MSRNQMLNIAAAGLLVVTGGLAQAQDVATKLTDEQITQHVKEKLAADEPKVAARIMVMTHDGVVTLAGRALTPGDIQMAVQDANNTDGVVRVDNRLKNA